jgi:hypothetical protein
MNIMQQIASSCGAAIMTVLLTNQTKNVLPSDLGGLADGFGFTFSVAVILVAVVLVPAALLPKGKAKPTAADAGEPAAAAMMH